MVFLEIVALLVVATVLITAIIAIGRPIAQLMAEKAHFKFKGIDSEAESRLLKRLEGLEEELRQTKSQLIELKDSVDFSKIIDVKAEAPTEHKTDAQSVKIPEHNKTES